MMFLETFLVYPVPPRNAGEWNPKWLNFEDVWFEAADGTKLHGWFVPHPNPKRAILYCHGNGEHIAFNAELAAHLRDKLHASVFLFDYRGYGRSEGRPNEAGCIADGRAAQQWLAKQMGIKPSDIVLMGRSLGGGVAVALAAENGAAALVLENTFPTMPDVAAVHYPWLPVRWVMDNRYDSLTRIKKYRGPLIQAHGADDTIVPMRLARRLFEVAPSSTKKWVEFPDCDHNSECPAGYYDTLATFLERNTTPLINDDSI
jgi:fermentation-respiration switch protein FrsA (DUF1100 family)